mgnify:CR=1 FL=1
MTALLPTAQGAVAETSAGRLSAAVFDSESTFMQFVVEVRNDGTGSLTDLSASISYEPGAPPPSMAVADPSIELSVVHEDEHLLVVDKPAGLLVHPVGRGSDPTLVHGIAHLREHGRTTSQVQPLAVRIRGQGRALDVTEVAAPDLARRVGQPVAVRGDHRQLALGEQEQGGGGYGAVDDVVHRRRDAAQVEQPAVRGRGKRHRRVDLVEQDLLDGSDRNAEELVRHVERHELSCA